MLLQTTLPEVDVVSVNDSIKAHTRYMFELLRTDPESYFTTLGHEALMFGLKVLAALVIYFVGAWLIRQIKRWQVRRFERRKTDPTVSSFIQSATSFSLTLLLIVITVGTLGIDTTSLAALLAAGGLAIGMALSGTVQNFAGGLMILVFKPFKVGDWIAAQGFSGTVTSVTITNTRIKTADNREVVLPNGILSNGVIDNYTTLPFRRLDLLVSVAYGTDADLCMSLLMQFLKDDERVLDSATDGCADPFVALKSLNESDISFAVRGFVKNEDFWGVTFDLNKRIYTELPQHGIQFAYPHMDITVLPQEK